MLVCNVSLRPRRTAIAADVAETTAAVDALATGNVVFATLVDDPASVRETVDAYLGEIMLEAASANDVISSGSIYSVAVDESATAVDSAASGTISTKSAMVAGPIFINPTSRDANADGVMVNAR